jgi:hypothetical protein
VGSAVAAAARPGAGVGAAAGFYLPLRLEAERGRLVAEVRALPEEAAAHPGWFVPALPSPRDAERLARESAARRPGSRIFVVMPPAYATPELLAAFEGSEGRTRELAKSRDVLVLLKTRGSGPPADPAAP